MKDEFFEKKLAKYLAQAGRCYVCRKKLMISEAQWAHIIPQTKRYLKKYTPGIIHHRLNARITCAECNSKVLMDPKTHPIEASALINEILKAVENERKSMD